METASPPGTDRQEQDGRGTDRQRRTEFAARLVRWQQVDDQLAELMGIAHDCAAGTWPRQPSAVPLSLRPNEWVLYQAPDVRMVEIDRVPGVPATGYTGYSAVQAAGLDDLGGTAAHEPVRSLESGVVTITNRRVLFHGRSGGEWAFTALLRIEHSPSRPLTLIHVTDRRWVSGLEYSVAQAPYLRFMLTLATVHHAGALDGFLAQLDAEREAHGAMRPVPPRTDPLDDPGLLDRLRALLLAGVGWWRGQPRLWQVVESVAAVAVVLVVALSFGSSGSAPSAAGRTGAQPIPEAPSSAEPPTSTPSGAPTASASSTATTSPSPSPTPTATTTPPPTASPTRSVDLCGAPANPYGYNFCGRGHVLHHWQSGVCSYFTCDANFGKTPGYLVECGDGTLSSGGGKPAACARHHGVAQTVYSGP